MILVYPVGVPLMILLMLVSYRDIIIHKDSIARVLSSDLVRKTRYRGEGYINNHFVHVLRMFYTSYTPACWYFEIIDVLQRLVLTSIIGVLYTSDETRYAVSAAFSCWVQMIYRHFKPFQIPRDNMLSNLGKFQVFLSFVVFFFCSSGSFDSMPAAYKVSIKSQLS